MPSSITHYLFAQQALDLANQKLKFLNDYIYPINLGTQGPDPLFFYGSIPWKKRKDTDLAKNLGNKLHSVEVVEKFIKMIEFAKTKQGKEKDLLFSYIFGHGLHYLLDREAHAYVFYMTGVDENGQLDKQHSIDHALFESMIDFEFPKHLGIATYAIKPHRTLNLKTDEIELISNMYSSEEKFDKDFFKNAWADMKYLLELFLDQNRTKIKIIKLLGLKNSLMHSMIHKVAKEKEDKIDYLNLTNKTWYNPASNQPSNQSFIDLFKKALADLPEWIRIIETAYSNQEYKANLKTFCANRGYDGVEIGQKMRYHKSVYLKGE